MQHYKPLGFHNLLPDQEEYYSLLENVRNPDRPVIVKKPRNVSVVLGEPFTVDCTAWGDPKPQVRNRMTQNMITCDS